MNHDAFMQAILEAPEEDVTRLVYADWLEERGDTRAEFLRVVVALFSPLSSDAYDTMAARRRELVKDFDPEWVDIVSRPGRRFCQVLDDDGTSGDRMRFLIRPLEGSLPNLPLGPRGRELQCYLPPAVEWRQLNYGQGEGQVEIAGREWGFYSTGDGGFAVVLHYGELAVADGLTFAQNVAEVIAPGMRCGVSFDGVDQACFVF